MEYIRHYSTIILGLWASPFALSGIIRNYDGEFPSKIARTLLISSEQYLIRRSYDNPS